MEVFFLEQINELLTAINDLVWGAPLIILLNAATLLISTFVLIAPSYLVSHIHPAKSMRYE